MTSSIESTIISLGKNAKDTQKKTQNSLSKYKYKFQAAISRHPIFLQKRQRWKRLMFECKCSTQPSLNSIPSSEANSNRHMLLSSAHLAPSIDLCCSCIMSFEPCRCCTKRELSSGRLLLQTIVSRHHPNARSIKYSPAKSLGHVIDSSTECYELELCGRHICNIVNC